MLILRQGVASGFVWPITDAAGAPADLTGYTARCQVRVREDPDAMLLAELTASVVGSTVVVQWTADESLLWDWPSGYSDVLLVDADGWVASVNGIATTNAELKGFRLAALQAGITKLAEIDADEVIDGETLHSQNYRRAVFNFAHVDVLEQYATFAATDASSGSRAATAFSWLPSETSRKPRVVRGHTATRAESQPNARSSAAAASSRA